MRLKNATVGRSDAKLHELIEWCTANQKLPTDPDDVFCGGIEYELDEFDKLNNLRICVTTTRLLSLTKHNLQKESFFLQVKLPPLK